MTGHASKGIFVVLILATVAGMTAMPAMAANSTINYDSSSAPQAAMTGDVTIADHPMGDDPLTYNNNSGEWTSLAASVNDSVDNPFEFVASDINFTDASAFPHDSENSSLSSEYWEIADADSDGSMSVDDVETAPGVDALSVATSDQTEYGSIATFDLTQTDIDAPITSDEDKRYLQLIGDINELDSDAAVLVKVVDDDGDYYEAEINSSRSSGEDMIANSTGEGVIYQQQLGELELNQNGDGTFNDIESIEIEVTEGDADLEISALNVGKMGEWDFGDRLEETDDDDELETEQIAEHKSGGPLALSDLGTMGDTFADAHIKSLTVPFEQSLEDLDDEDVEVSFTDADRYESYDSQFEGDFRFELPTAYDLGYEDLELTDEVSVPDTRYTSVEYAEGTGDTEIADISSWSEITSSYESMDDRVSIDDTIQPGTAMVVSYDYLITEDEKASLEAVGGVVGTTGESEGILDMLFSLPGMIISGVVGFLGARKIGVF